MCLLTAQQQRRRLQQQPRNAVTRYTMSVPQLGVTVLCTTASVYGREYTDGPAAICDSRAACCCSMCRCVVADALICVARALESDTAVEIVWSTPGIGIAVRFGTVATVL